MTNVYIEDSGYVNWDYSLSETKFPIYSNATNEELQFGEFKVQSRVELKITAINYGSSANDQVVNKVDAINTSITRTSYQPISFSMTGFLSKPKNTFNDPTVSKKNLIDIPNITMMQFTKGHKNLYIVDDVDTDREKLFSLYYLLDWFGNTDATEYAGTKNHLNMTVDSVTLNEGENNIAVNITGKLLWSL